MNYFDSPWTADFPIGMIGIDLCRLGDVLSTKPVRFTVGAERAEFHLHEGLVSCLSAPLHALANRAPTAHLHDVDASVFSCFAQFAYSGHYDPETTTENHFGCVDGRTRTQRNMLLQHAQLWVFAQTYQAESLKRAAQMQLTNKLIISMMSPVTFFAEFGELVRYVYGGSSRFGLRQTVSHFAATVAAGLYHLAGWQDLLLGCPGFSWDVLSAMSLLEGS